MRAKFINEIKQDIESSGFAPIGVGKVIMHRGYDYIVKHWPAVREKLIFNNNDSDQILATIDHFGLNAEELGLNKLEKVMNCSITDMAIIRVHKAPIKMCSWIMEEALKDTPKDTTMVVHHGSMITNVWMRASSYWNVGKIQYYTTENVEGKERTISSTFYFIRYK